MRFKLLIGFSLLLASCGQTPAFTAQAETIPIQTLYLEGINQGEHGMVLIGEVIRNRSKLSGKSYDEVCLQPKQFSCWNRRGYYKHRLDKMTGDDWQIASKAWVESETSNFTRGATMYHAKSVNPDWAKYYERTLKYKAHLFYRQKGLK